MRRRRLGRRPSPSRASPPRVGAGSLALVAMLAAPACDSPTRPLATPLGLAGELLAGGTVSYPVELLDDGTLEVELLELVPILVEVSSGQELALGFALGRPSGDACVASSTVAPFSLGDRLLYALAEGSYCISIYDAGYIPADAHVRYQVTVHNRYES